MALLWKAILSPIEEYFHVNHIFLMGFFHDNEIKKTFVESENESGVFIDLRIYQYSTARVSYKHFPILYCSIQFLSMKF